MNPVEPTLAHATEAPETIVMYGADWCGDCLRAKAYFAEHKIEFDFVDLVEHEQATDVVLARNGGVQKIPVIIFPDNSHLTEPTNADLEAKMTELAAVPSPVETHDVATDHALIGSSVRAEDDAATVDDAAVEDDAATVDDTDDEHDAAVEGDAAIVDDAAEEDHSTKEGDAAIVEYVVVENADDGRFELRREGELLSFANYSNRAGNVVVVPHVETLPHHRGAGNADRLMDGLLTQLRESGRSILPLCPFAAQHLRDNPHNQDLQAKDL